MIRRLRDAIAYLREAEERLADVPPREPPLLPQQVLIVLLHPKRRELPDHAHLAVSGALVAELIHEDRLTLTGSGRKIRAVVQDDTPLGEPRLDDVLMGVASGWSSTKVRRLLHSADPGAYLTHRQLVESGKLLVEEKRIWPSKLTLSRYEPTPAAGRDALVESVRSALLGESVPDDHTALLIGLVTAVTSVQTFVPRKLFKTARGHLDQILERLSDQERLLVTAVDLAQQRASISD